MTVVEGNPEALFSLATVSMNHMNSNKTHWEKARREFHKNTTSYTEQMLEGKPHEITADLLGFHLWVK